MFPSELTEIEFNSTVWKKLRTKEITEANAKTVTNHFLNDANKYTLIKVNSHVIQQANVLMNKYGLQGLKTLDSIQFATDVSLTNDADLFVTSDKLLESFFIQEALPV